MKSFDSSTVKSSDAKNLIDKEFSTIKQNFQNLEKLGEYNGFLPKGRRRSKKDKSERNYRCGCSKTYFSYPALYTHIKNKHNGNPPDGTTLGGGDDDDDESSNNGGTSEYNEFSELGTQRRDFDEDTNNGKESRLKRVSFKKFKQSNGRKHR